MSLSTARSLSFLALLTCAAAAGAATRPVTFTYRPERDVSKVAVAGEFNGWSGSALEMRRAGVGGPFEATVELAEGRHLYKFVVDGAFVTDPRGKERVPDGFGGFNSVVNVGAVDARAARVGDGVISEGFVKHRTLDAGQVEGQVALRLVVRAGDVEGVAVVTPEGTVAAERVASDGDEELFEARLDRSASKYLFRVRDGATVRFVGPRGVGPRAAAVGMFGGEIHGHGAPAWLGDAVFYQIFPDRFRNGDRGNDPASTGAWGEKPANTSWQGGDLAGVRQALDYLAGLGVNALYLNPIFASDSNHGYNTADYETVAGRFGGNAGFAALMDDLKRRGMRVILDGVFNHTGTAFFAFQDLVKRGARSAYANWYTVKSWPVNVSSKNPNYESWWGFGSLPKLRVDSSAAVREYLLGVVRKWTRAGIDGWRLDVPNEVGHPFWKAFRAAVRAVNPETYIVGEIWEDGSPWLGGDEFDGVMNYRFRRALLDFVAKETIDATAAARQLDRVRMDYAPGVTGALFDLLGSHDTERFLTLAGGAQWKMAAATTALLTAAGVPSIYYGDEVGLEGGKDPDNRRSFPWGRTRGHPLLDHHRRLIALRKHEALGHFGEATHWALSPDVLAFARPGPHGERLIVLINRGRDLPLPDQLLDRTRAWRVLEGQPGRIAGHFATVLLGR